jgi:hypothetical protein
MTDQKSASKTGNENGSLNGLIDALHSETNYPCQTGRNKIFHIDKQQHIIQEDPLYIRAWLKIYERIIKTVKQEQAQRNTERIFMDNYFNWQPTKYIRR